MILKSIQESFCRKTIGAPDIESAFRSIRVARALATDLKRFPPKALSFLLQEGLQRLPTGQLRQILLSPVRFTRKTTVSSSATQAVLARRGAALQTQSVSCALYIYIQYICILINRSFASASYQIEVHIRQLL